MMWICPRCGYNNSGDLKHCNICHISKLGHETYQKREYIYRLKPTSSPIAFLEISFGFLLSACGLLFCIIKIVNSVNMTLSLAFCLLGIIFLCIGIYFIINGKSGHNALNLLKEGRSVTKAEVLGRYTEEYEDKQYSAHYIIYFIDIRFNAGAKKYVINAKVNKEIYEKAERGNLLEVTYAISDPRILIFENEQFLES